MKDKRRIEFTIQPERSNALAADAHLRQDTRGLEMPMCLHIQQQEAMRFFSDGFYFLMKQYIVDVGGEFVDERKLEWQDI